MSKYAVISGPYIPVFGLNAEEYGTEITPYLDTFHAVKGWMTNEIIGWLDDQNSATWLILNNETFLLFASNLLSSRNFVIKFP